MNFRLAPLDSINLSFMMADDDMIFSGGWWRWSDSRLLGSLRSGSLGTFTFSPVLVSLCSVSTFSPLSQHNQLDTKENWWQGETVSGMERIIYTYWAKHAQYFAQIILSLKQKCLLKPVSFLPPFNSLASQHSQLDRENYALRLVTTLCVLYPRLTFALEHESFIFRWNHQKYFSAVLLTKPLTHELRSVLVAFHPHPPFWSRPV